MHHPRGYTSSCPALQTNHRAPRHIEQKPVVLPHLRLHGRFSRASWSRGLRFVGLKLHQHQFGRLTPVEGVVARNLDIRPRPVSAPHAASTKYSRHGTTRSPTLKPQPYDCPQVKTSVYAPPSDTFVIRWQTVGSIDCVNPHHRSRQPAYSWRRSQSSPAQDDRPRKPRMVVLMLVIIRAHDDDARECSAANPSAPAIAGQPRPSDTG